MRRLVRSPLAWMAVAEVLVVGALIAVAWHVVASSGHPVSSPAQLFAPGPTDDASPLPELPAFNPVNPHGPLPGLNVDPSFWRDRLAHLNEDQAYLEQLEWRIVRNAEDAIQRYLETVVLPAIQRAERAERAGGGAPG